jgi:hypothetical protein
MDKIMELRLKINKLDALCNYYDPDLWFSRSINCIKCAVEICNGCIAKQLCNELGKHITKNSKNKIGIWGGQYYNVKKNIQEKIRNKCVKSLSVKDITNNRYLMKRFQINRSNCEQ